MNKKVYFKLYLDYNIIIYCKYIFIEKITKNKFGIYFKSKKTNNIKKERFESEKIRVQFIINRNNEEIIINEFKIFTDIKNRNLNSNFYLEGFIDFIDDYYEYNQEVIDLLCFWNNNSTLLNSKKETWTYTLATLIYSGLPINIPFDKTVYIDGNHIISKYHFFNILAEKLLGEKKYIGSNLDALYSSLKGSNIKQSKNSSVIKISNFLKLKIIFKPYGVNYLSEILSILNEFGFKINIVT